MSCVSDCLPCLGHCLLVLICCRKLGGFSLVSVQAALLPAAKVVIWAQVTQLNCRCNTSRACLPTTLLMTHSCPVSCVLCSQLPTPPFCGVSQDFFMVSCRAGLRHILNAGDASARAAPAPAAGLAAGRVFLPCV